jgi:hypothetical protein
MPTRLFLRVFWDMSLAMGRKFRALIAIVVLSGCVEPVAQQGEARILLLGDSMMASNRLSGQSVSRVIEATRGEPVVDRSVPAALFASISQQYRPGPWDMRRGDQRAGVQGRPDRKDPHPDAAHPG